MADLVQMGKHAFDVTCRSGQFFFPKVAIGRMAENTKIEIGQYESELDQFTVLLKAMALNGPIDWIAHTADSYQFLLDANRPGDLETYEQIQRGETTVTQLFENGDERTVEALTIVKLNRFGFSNATMAPYTRLDGRKIHWFPIREMSGAKALGGTYLDVMRDTIARSLQTV